MEEWRNITYWPGYQVSNLGRVRSPRRVLKSIVHRKKSGRVARATVGDGYWHWSVHRLVLDAFVGPAPEGAEACHFDGDPLNNRLENLRWDTHRGNMADAIRHKTMGHRLGGGKGVRNVKAKLDENDVRCIRAEPHFPQILKMLAEAFGVSKTNIHAIRSGKTWAHLPQYF